eukprot:Filipodium_phascolosomae@DN2217_c0_g1_i1.p2
MDSSMTDAADTATAIATKDPIFELKKWSAVCAWAWDLQVDTCAICRNSLYEPSIEHQALSKSEVVIAWGKCNHCFHLECIQRWLKTRNVCPLCGQEWDFQKVQHIQE